MNKQEAIEQIKKLKMAFATKLARSEKKSLSLTSGATVVELQDVIGIINQIDEPEKPVIPQFVAEHIEYHKSMNSPMGDIFNRHFIDDKRVEVWLRETLNAYDNLGKAWLFGYEVEKEKRYTARLKVVTIKKAGYLNGHNKNDSITIDTSYTAGGQYQVYFTRSELEELGVWDNPAFEIKEAE